MNHATPGIFLANTPVQLPMQVVHIFDIAKKAWFAQSTTAQGGYYPSARLEFCSVMTSPEDNSSYNIYIYGGKTFDSVIDNKKEIFILTLPAFHWVAMNTSAGLNESYASPWQANGYRCQKVHEKYMVSYWGYFDLQCGDIPELQRFQGMVIYDMSSLTWTTKVELENQKYLVPQALYDIIGGK